MTSGIAGLTAQGPTPAQRSADESAMRRALAAARRAGLAGEPPIGACLVRNGSVLATASNSVISSLDITAHAEINLIRDACRRERALDLAGCELFTTVEPCPMCLAASHYARIGRIVFGASLGDLHALTGAEMLAVPVMAPGGPMLSGGCLREESLALLRAWCA
jgi:tRNA(Arg) A34 adenosine deaminase TadA